MALTAQQSREAAIAVVKAEPGLETMSKTDLVAAVVAADAWATTNAASYTAALPLPFRTTSTAAQKAALLSYVALRRWQG